MQDIFIVTIAATGISSLLEYSGIMTGRFRKTMFLYYTNLSNLIVCVYFTLLASYRSSGANHLRFTENAAVSYSVMMIIFMTLLVFHFVLVPYAMKNKEIIHETGISIPGCIMFHYIIPVFTVAYWFIYADRNITSPITSILWLIFPGIYLIFIILRSKKGNIPGTKSRFPYPFLDMDRTGKAKFAENVFSVFIIFVALSVIIYHFS